MNDDEIIRLRDEEQLTFREIGIKLGYNSKQMSYRYRFAKGLISPNYCHKLDGVDKIVRVRAGKYDNLLTEKINEGHDYKFYINNSSPLVRRLYKSRQGK